MSEALTAPEILRRAELPFTIGCFATPHNPPGFPDVLPFELAVDHATGLLVQQRNPALEAMLDAAYATGSLIGTATDDSALGAVYARQFVDFIAARRPLEGARALEIGAGRGYFVRCLLDRGADALGLEPGRQNRPYWEQHRVRIVEDRFPSSAVDGTFDLIAGIAVLEHVPDLAEFLAHVGRALAPGGAAAFALPNCAPNIEAGDPSMLLHEHFSYFTPDTLRRCLERSGFAVEAMELAPHGNVIHCLAAPTGPADWSLQGAELGPARSFAAKAERLRRAVVDHVGRRAKPGAPLGVYCPARALALLPFEAPLRFFDDDPNLAGRFYPPFPYRVETRQELLAEPVHEMVIFSRAFGERIRSALSAEPSLASCSIVTMDELDDAARSGLA